jgi:cobalamin synthase
MVRAVLVTAICAFAALVPAAMAAQASTPAVAGAHGGSIQMAKFGSSRGFGRSSRGFGRSRSHGILRRVVRALAIGYLLHLLFTTPGGLIVLVLLVLLVVFAMRRMRSRRFGY